MTIVALQVVTCQAGDTKHSFVCGNAALDFASTFGSRLGAPVELFPSPESLDSSFCESGIVDGDIKFQPADLDEAILIRAGALSRETAASVSAP
ncbi:hypothetical protein QFZ69_004690 [Arthrobacter sp. V1I7]|uniref:hypothetical protein n=1 Tax=Arthrobacter sp. V1I7 TaxID=3042274 RepID=UPI0027813E7D|nr:hypothetical protein [Arthrobacter sp. V1I7]MDQ0823744.1 hypothetical protein [Arthrobacter sp. V1I7]